jgi:hypothetical protein
VHAPNCDGKVRGEALCDSTEAGGEEGMDFCVVLSRNIRCRAALEAHLRDELWNLSSDFFVNDGAIANADVPFCDAKLTSVVPSFVESSSDTAWSCFAFKSDDNDSWEDEDSSEGTSNATDNDGTDALIVYEDLRTILF